MSDSNYDNLIERLKPNSQTSEPYYLQLKRKISGLIDSGELTTGLCLPSERVLAEALNLSRTTIRRCYEELRSSGVLDSHGGGGALIKETPRVSPALGRLNWWNI